MSTITTCAPEVAEAAVLPRLRRLPLPVVEPNPAQRVLPDPRPDGPHTQGTLALVLPPATIRGTTDAGPCPADAVRVGPPDPAAWATQFVQAAVEVAAGARSPGQLVRWTSPEVHARLARRSALSARISRGASARPRAVVRTVLTCSPRDGVCEASAVVVDRGRVRALALRMEGLDGRWRVTALEMG